MRRTSLQLLGTLANEPGIFSKEPHLLRQKRAQDDRILLVLDGSQHGDRCQLNRALILSALILFLFLRYLAATRREQKT